MDNTAAGRSIEPDARFLDDASPLGKLVTNQCRQLLGRAARRLRAERGNAVAHFAGSDGTGDDLVELRDDGSGDSAGRKYAPPRGGFVPGEPRFRDGRQVGEI